MEDNYSFITMKRNRVYVVFVAVIFCLSGVECAKVVKSGIEQLSLNAKRESVIWTAMGNNGTQGTKLKTDIIH